MNNISKLIISLLFFFSSCNQLPPYKNKQDLIGNWHGKSVEITTPSHSIAFFAIRKYGFANFTFSADSSYSFSLDIMKDVVLEKEMLGNSYAKTIINAGYKNYKRGFYLASNDRITFYDANRLRVNDDSYYFDERLLISIHIDKDNRLWKISWEKED